MTSNPAFTRLQPPQVFTPGAGVLSQESQTQGRSFLLFFGLTLIFLRFSMLHQILTLVINVNLYLLYIIGIPAILATVFSGGAMRVLRYRNATYWLWFALWMVIAVPFSSWKGGSAAVAFSYVRTDFIMMFVIGSVAINWREARRLMWVIASACVANLFISRYFGQTDMNDRASLVYFGTVSNANDFAGHLTLVLPFLLWVAMSSKSVVLRVLATAGLAWGLYLILASASRGAAVALAVGIVFLIFNAPGRLRIVFLITALPLVLFTMFLIPQRALERIFSFSSSQTNVAEEALLSSQLRQKLFSDSVKYAITHPVFGVGPGQFSINEGMETKRQNPNAVALWAETHDSLTQIASECGLPALMFYLLGTGSTFFMLRRTLKRVQGVPRLADMAKALFCLQLSMVAYCTAILFLNFGYFFYLPGMAGIAIVMDIAATAELGAAVPAAATPVFQNAPFRPPVLQRPARQPLPRFDGRITGLR